MSARPTAAKGTLRVPIGFFPEKRPNGLEPRGAYWPEPSDPANCAKCKGEGVIHWHRMGRDALGPCPACHPWEAWRAYDGRGSFSQLTAECRAISEAARTA